MSIGSAWGGATAVNYSALVGRYQLVTITDDIGTATVKVSNFSVGVTQEIEVPPLVSGATDDITWSKGAIRVEGSISAPLTSSLASKLIRACNNVVQDPTNSDITLFSSVHGSVVAKVNSCTISCQAGQKIEVSARIIGRLGEYHNSAIDSHDAAYVDTTYGGDFTSLGIGATPTGIALEQIPVFDQVVVNYDMLPVSHEYALVSGVEFTIDNQLEPAYILGAAGTAAGSTTDGTGGEVTNGSSLDAFTLYSKGRVLSGSMTFQSGTTGKLGYVKNAGTGDAATGDFVNFAGLVGISASKYVPVWNAAPPELSTNLTTYTLPYRLVANEAGFHISVS